MKNKSIVVFKNSFLEGLTHVDPRTPIIIWLPVALFLSWRAFALGDIGIGHYFLFSFLGLLVWTFVEYALHRWFFHFPAKSAHTKRMVFIFHGLHHDDPNDKTRLVMPPAPALIYVVLLYSFFKLALGPVFIDPFFSWFLIGYLCYDYIHYGTHHWAPKTALGRYLRKFHLQHHVQGEVKFGVSNPLWDYVFRTVEKRSAATQLRPATNP